MFVVARGHLRFKFLVISRYCLSCWSQYGVAVIPVVNNEMMMMMGSVIIVVTATVVYEQY